MPEELIELEPWAFRLPAPWHHVEITRTSVVQEKPWYICRGGGRGTSQDYWRDVEGWSFTTPSRYATPQEAARSFMRQQNQRIIDGGDA